jgi:membrane-bound lytic murein transglycosylase B
MQRNPASRRIGAILLAAGWLAGLEPAAAQPQPAQKLASKAEPALKPAGSQAVKPAEAKREDFRRFVENLWPDAKARRVSRETFDAAFRGVAPDPKIIALTKKQSEFVQPIWGYLAGAVGGARLSRGREVAERWSAQLDRIERTYGVPRSVVLGIWGMETNFGSFTGSMPVIQSLATLAYTRYRGDFFRNELLVALEMIEQGHVEPAALRGSWAGAMGHTQFMPTSFMQHAVDGDGDGRRDIWSSPADALASTANYLRNHGWQPGLPWGFEVALPEGFDYRNVRQGFAAWSRLGVSRADRQPMPRSGEAMLFLPAGARGPAFLVTENYNAIKAYNSSDAYALGVAHLGDLILGGAAIAGEWPKSDPQLGQIERVEVQKRLATLGHYFGEADGKFGSKTREAVREFQLARGLLPDGYADPAVLKALRGPR